MPVVGRIIGPPWDHPWRCKQSPLAVIGPTSCSLAQVTNIHWRVNYEARKRKQTRMESLHRPSGGHVVQVILSGAHNAPERIYKSRMHDSYSYSFSHGFNSSEYATKIILMLQNHSFNFVACVASISTEIN